MILDAARDLIATVGIRRTTMADVARAAKVSRATLYRRFPNIETLAASVTTREFNAVLDAAPTGAELDAAIATEPLDVLVGLVVHLVHVSREHPLLRRIVELDPEWLTPYLLQRTGRTSTAQLDRIEAVVTQAVAAGVVRQDDPHELATAILLLAWSFALTGPVFATPDVLDHQLTELLTRYLKP
ncbi:TetR/AcrR family transcriptional regulator [Tsukamurella soli]|uniref:TetR/AcrR family transcriptional regulator n=1 Tax=Tsukamurella soli TaxID=644556 RepID=UPI00361AEB7D